MISSLESAACLGLDAYRVHIEVDVASGLPQFNVVGLPDQSIKESRERVRAAIKNSGYPFPPDRITINLAPADIKKEGPAFDLAMAIGILEASEVLKSEKIKNFIFLGELALDGSLRPIKGAIALTAETKEKSIILPAANAAEASLSAKNTVYPARHLSEVIQFLRDEEEIIPSSPHLGISPRLEPCLGADFADVKGQFFAKRAIEVAVAGGHNILLVGPPGSGKSMLSQRVPSILPLLSYDEALEITKIHSVAGYHADGLFARRPFRAPHHSISMVALAGGGSFPKPGEVSLAHGGVLFLDEFPEFRRDALEALRGPLEDGKIHISRAKSQIIYPARFMLVAAMNPCPCGHLFNAARSCRCSLGQIQKYQAKISGPILDRIDIHAEVPALDYKTLSASSHEESSEKIRGRITECRKTQSYRFEKLPFKINALMGPREIKTYALLEAPALKLLESAMKSIRLSARAYFKVIKVARTVADLGQSETIREEHIAEAIQYRSLDRQWRG